MVTIYALTATSSVFALKGCPLLQGRWCSGAWESLWLPLLWFRCVSGGPLYSVHRCRWILLRLKGVHCVSGESLRFQGVFFSKSPPPHCD